MNPQAQASAPTMVDFALRYAKMGFKVFPVHSATDNGICSCNKGRDCSSTGKHPISRNGLSDGTCDEVIIRQFWQSNPQANIGLVTGPEFGVVLDIDPRHGGYESLKKIEEEYGSLPYTVVSNTGGDGKHFIFQCPEDLPNRTSIRPGVDFKATRGYIVAPPSKHASGKRYEWENGKAPWETAFAPLPDALLGMITARTDNSSSNAGNQDFFSEGERNDGMFKLAANYRQLGMNYGPLLAVLRAENQSRCRPPLPDDEISALAKNAMKYGPESIAWGTLSPLPKLEADIPDLTPEMLPESIRPWALDVSERMQVPLDFLAIPFLVCASSAIGRRAQIRPKKRDPWAVIPNLWGMLVSPPGTMKTPCLAQGISFLQSAQEEAHKLFEKNAKTFAIEEALAKAQIERLKKEAEKSKNPAELSAIRRQIESREEDLEKKKPIRKRYVVNDCTVEKLIEILGENPFGILYFRDELAGFLKNLDKKGHEGDRAFFLEAWAGTGSHTSDRIGRGVTRAEHVCISLLGGIQRDRLSQHFEQIFLGNSDDDGLLARFQLLVCPRLKTNYIHTDREADQLAITKVTEVFLKILRLGEGVPAGKEGEPLFTCQFSEEAQPIYDEWAIKLENRLRSEQFPSTAFTAHMSKYRKLMPSLALIFHIAEETSKPGNGFTANLRVVPAKCAELAIAWCSFLEAHARSLYSPTISPELHAAHALAEKIESREIKDGMSIRDLYRHEWAGLKSPEIVKKGLGLLVMYNWLKIVEVKGPRGGAPSDVIKINPALLAKVKEAK